MAMEPRMTEKFKRIMSGKSITINAHIVRDFGSKEMLPADLYVFGCPGHIGKSICSMRRFLKNVQLRAGTPYAILTVEEVPQPNKRPERCPRR